MDYKAEAEYRYESAFKQLQEKEATFIARSRKWTNEKSTLMTRMDKAMEEILRQRRKVATMESGVTRLRGRCHSMETVIHEKDHMLEVYGMEIDNLQQDLMNKGHELEINNEIIALL